jgi:hypothetical protein
VKRKLLMTVAVFIGSTATMSAHDLKEGVNGGQVVETKGHHFEFTTKDGTITLYLTDEKDQPIASKGASGRVIIQSNGTSATVDLAPAEPNLLTAKASAPLTADAKVVVSAKLADGHDVQARFVAK